MEIDDMWDDEEDIQRLIKMHGSTSRANKKGSDSHVCDECGEVFATARKIDSVYSSTTYPDGRKEVLTEPKMVSPCCRAGFETFND